MCLVYAERIMRLVENSMLLSALVALCVFVTQTIGVFLLLSIAKRNVLATFGLGFDCAVVAIDVDDDLCGGSCFHGCFPFFSDIRE